MISVQTFIEQCETMKILTKNKHRLVTLNKSSVFSINNDSDPLNKMKIENAKLYEKIKQNNETIEILQARTFELESGNSKVDKVLMDKSERIARMQQECELLRIKLQQYESELTDRIGKDESKKLKTDNDYLTREITKLRSENHKQKDMLFVLSRQVETHNKMKEHNSKQIEILNNALNTMAADKDDNQAIAKMVNELSVQKLQAIY